MSAITAYGTDRLRLWRRLRRANWSITPSYYFRGATFFETSAAQYVWLTRHIVVCAGDREPARVKLKFYQVL